MREWLIEKRKHKNFTKSKVAKDSGISLAYYSLIENGKRNVSVDTAKKIAKILNFDWQIFYEE